MATDPNGLSLALVLLQTSSQYSTSEAQNVSQTQAGTSQDSTSEAHVSQTEADKYIEWRRRRDSAKGDEDAKNKLKQVQVSLYKTLYQIVEDYELPHNNALNMAIGKALAIVIEDHNIGVGRDPKLRDYVDRLVNVLKPVVTEAVNAVEENKS